MQSKHRSSATVPAPAGANTSPVEPIAFNIATAAFVAGLGRTTLFEAIRTGELKSFKHHGRRLVMRDDLLAWLRAARDAA